MNVVVTGANKGLGFCLAKLFVERGHRVLAGSHKVEDAHELKALESANKERLVVIPMDVSDESSISAASQTARDVFGSVDVLINNAGILMPTDRTQFIYDLDIDDLRKTIEVNTVGTVIVMKYFLPVMRDDGTGTMIFVTSEAGSVSSSGSNFPAYSMSKAAANKAVFILRATVGDKYRIFALHPGRMNTDMGRTTAQIEPEESAEGIYSIVIGMKDVDARKFGFIDYKGEPMLI